MIKISIIIPVYNVEKYIQRCLKSVMIQNANVANIECIIIDDKSTDKSFEIISKTINEYDGAIKFLLLRNECNLGVSISRNKGMESATGDFILFLDSDDYFTADCVETLVKGYSDHPEADIIIGNTEECLSKKAIHNICTPCYIGNGLDSRRWMLNEKKCFTWNRLIRREIIVKNHIYFTPSIVYEDILWTYQLYKYISSIYLLPNITHYYEYNPTSITKLSSQKAELHVKSYTKVCIGILKTDYEHSLFIQQHLFILWAILCAIDFDNKYTIQGHTKKLLSKTKKLLMGKVLTKGRIILALYFLIMYQPFSKILQIKAFRRYYIHLSNSVGRIASLFNWLHQAKNEKIPTL